LVAVLAGLLLAPSQAAQEALLPVYAAALSGDGVKALAELSRIDAKALDVKEAARADCIRDALLAPPREEALPPLSNAVLLAYRSYWQDSMMRRVTREDAEAELKRRLDAILAQWRIADSPSDSLGAASEQARQAVGRDGLFALAGVTAPYYELALWRSQSERRYDVQLHDRRVATRVVFLDDFVSFGWAGFATCNRAHTGGWATRTALFAVRSAYDLDSEAFRVSYLAHEARHFSDYRRFPNLEQPELEYRAKLTELALAETTSHRLIAGFARTASRDRYLPHHFANYWVATDMSRSIFGSAELVDSRERWERVPAPEIRAAARQLLAANERNLLKSDPKSVSRFLGE